ncbi:MAG: metal ABC transporter permease [Phycisphaerales bacterium]|nr:metal ABC transporter permease [Phycisphaerales bacterium]
MTFDLHIWPEGSEWWVVTAAALACAACAVIGTFLVLRRLSLLGDAISHAILPGIAMAFILSGSRDVWPMLLGALAAGLATAGLTAGIQRVARLGSDASLGVVFSSLFAFGVLLITWVADRVDLDPGCVLYGQIEFVPLDTTTVLGIDIPRAVLWLSMILVADLLFVIVLFKELRLSSFDPAMSTAMGFGAGVIHYLLMTFVAATCVAAFESVGSILVVAMLVAPGATAHLLTDRLSSTLVLAAFLGVTAAFLGFLGAKWFDTSVAGVISVAAGVQFLTAALLAPRHGIVTRWVRRGLLAIRIAREDELAALYRQHEASPEPSATLTVLPPSTLRQRLARRLLRLDQSVRRINGGLSLTPAGLEQGAAIVRAHRLWETYLAQKTDLPLDHLHEASHRVEHFVSAELAKRLSKAVQATQDPHGRPIPPV